MHLSDINLEINAGDRIGIIGKNGAGKTTLVETIIGVNNAKVSGELSFSNNVQNSMKAIFQEYQYDRVLTLKQVYKIYSLISGVKPKKDIDKLFDYYDLSGFEKRKFHSLSGGEKQKFKLLMCLELKPKLLILDEISSSLDFEWRSEIFTVINRYSNENKDCALLLISHDYNELKNLTSRRYLIKNGTNIYVENLEDYFNETKYW